MKRFAERIRTGARNRMWLYLPGAAVFLLALMAVNAGGPAGLYRYFNGPLLLWLTLFFLFLMAVTGIGRDLTNGLRIVFARRKGVTRMELQRAAGAMEAAVKVVVLEGVIAVGFRMVDALYDMVPLEQLLGPIANTLFLSLLYWAVFSLVLIPLRVRLENMAISFMEETDGEEKDEEQDSQTVYFRFRAMGLTDREAEVARLVCLGLSNKEIGQTLYISDTTVKKHMTHILEKAGCESREGLAETVKEKRDPREI